MTGARVRARRVGELACDELKVPRSGRKVVGVTVFARFQVAALA